MTSAIHRLGIVLAAGMIVLGLAPVSVRAATPLPPPQITAAVQQLVLEAWPQADPDDPTDRPPPPPKMTRHAVNGWLKSGALRPVKLSSGKGSDWLIDTGQLGVNAWFCGTGGCQTQIWVSTGQGYVKVFDTQVRSIRFHWIKGPIKGSRRTWLEADFHGSLCGTFGAAACPWGFEWRDDGRGHYGLFSSLRFVRAEGLHPGPPPQGVDPLADPAASGVPDVIVQTVAAGRAACAKWQATFNSDGLASRLPDLNGDGIDDWSYSGAASYCTFPTDENDSSGESKVPHAGDDACTILDCENIVWLSKRGADGVSWVRAPLDPQRNFALRYSPRRPLQLIELDNPPGVKDDDPAACDTFTIETCVQKPISLSPKT